MRAGGCSVQQALSLEAASVVKQSVNLARRRGHAQVTPLHVANTMLCTPSGLLRAACLQSHSHPLQCKALELCFNVALNRLPASNASSPMLGPHHHLYHHPPSLSNALVAAFKRAQAHQRRGSIENQQQPLLAVKIELEQLIISILDDPSVSRVMREAGFSSTQVKNNVEQAVSSEICATTTPPNTNTSTTPTSKNTNEDIIIINPSKELGVTDHDNSLHTKNEDVMAVVEALVSRKNKSLVIIGECFETTDCVVKGVMNKLDRKDHSDLPELLNDVQLINLPLHSFRNMTTDEVEQRVKELKCLLKSCCAGGRGAILYMGDLKYTTELRSNSMENINGTSDHLYCPVKHVIMEMSNMVFNGVLERDSTIEDTDRRLWLLGVATYQTYATCKIKQPSLGTLWALKPLIIPSGSLTLSLNCTSDLQSQMKSNNSSEIRSLWPVVEDASRSQLTCCEDCSITLERQARDLTNTSCHSTGASSLPSWLRQYKEEEERRASDDQRCVQLKDLCRNWSHTACNSMHKSSNHVSEITLNFSSNSTPHSSCLNHCKQLQPWLLSLEAKHPWREHSSLCMTETSDVECYEQISLRNSKTSNILFQQLPTDHRSNPNSITTSSETMEMEYVPKFKELNAENLKNLCSALESRVAWQQDIIPDLASTILKCRSGMARRKIDHFSNSVHHELKQDTWLFFQGGDTSGKDRVARLLASLVFGSQSKFISIGLNAQSSTRSDSNDHDVRSKRCRAEAKTSYLERLFQVLSENPHRVIMIEDIEQLDYYTQTGIKSGMESGRIKNYNGDEVSLSDAIIILSCETFDCRSRASSPSVRHKVEIDDEKEEISTHDDEKEVGINLSLDLNLSIAEEIIVDDHSFDTMGLIQFVDRAFFFKLPQDL